MFNNHSTSILHSIGVPELLCADKDGALALVCDLVSHPLRFESLKLRVQRGVGKVKMFDMDYRVGLFEVMLDRLHLETHDLGSLKTRRRDIYLDEPAP